MSNNVSKIPSTHPPTSHNILSASAALSVLIYLLCERDQVPLNKQVYLYTYDETMTTAGLIRKRKRSGLTIFNYIFDFELPGECLYLSPQNTHVRRRRRRRQKADCFRTCLRNFPEVPNEKHSEILCLLGCIVYDVHLCNNISILQRNPENRPAQKFGLISLLPVLGQ